MSCSQLDLSDYHPPPAYTAEPRRGYEQRLLVHGTSSVPPSIPAPPQWGDQFMKQSKSGGVTLKVSNQMSNVPFPIHHGGTNNPVRGYVDLAKTENLEGRLLLQEVAAGGRSATDLCSQRVTLCQTRDQLLVDSSTRQGHQISLPFTLVLPTTFSDENGTYPLPPSFECNLSGLPGFHTTITYSLSVVVNKNKSSLFSFGNPTISTPLIYLPRSRPPTSPPPPLYPAVFTPRLNLKTDWQAFTTTVKSKHPFKGAPPDLQDIESRLYLHPAREFPIVNSIPFYLSFLSSSGSLAAFMPFGPQTPGSSGSSIFGRYQCTRMRLTRQVIVDAQKPNLRAQAQGRGRERASSVSGHISSSSEVWDMSTIGEGSFQLFNHGPDWITFYGEIPISNDVRVSGFKTVGLLVRDFLALTMVPPDPTKSPFKEFRHKVPIRLTTDPWA